MTSSFLDKLEWNVTAACLTEDNVKRQLDTFPSKRRVWARVRKLSLFS